MLVSGVVLRDGTLALLSQERRENPTAATTLLLDGAPPSSVSSAHAAGVRAMLLEDVAPRNLFAAVVAVHSGRRVFDPGLAPLHREVRVALSDREIEVSGSRPAARHARDQPGAEHLEIDHAHVPRGRDPQDGRDDPADAARAARNLGWL